MSLDNFNPDILNNGSRNASESTVNQQNESNSSIDKNRPKKKKKPQPAKTVKSNPFVKFMEFCQSKNLRVFVGVVLIAISIVMTLAFLSNINNQGVDHSVIQNNSASDVALKGDKVENTFGALGASISYSLMENGIGYAAFFIPLWLFLLGFKILPLKMGGGINMFKCTYNCLLMMILVSAIFEYASPELLAGGCYGQMVNDYLVLYVGSAGAFMIYAVIAFALALLWLSNIVSFFLYIKALMPKPKPRKHREEIEDMDSNDDDDAEENDKISAKPEQIAFDDEISEIEPQQQDETLSQPVVPVFDSEVPEQQDNTETLYNNVANGVTITDESGEMQVNVVENEIEQVQADEYGSINSLYDPTRELSHYEFPSIELLEDRKVKNSSIDEDEQKKNIQRITETLGNYGIQIKKIDACVGPTVTLFEIVPADGVRISRIKNLENDIAMSLAALGIRIIAPIPGRGTIGIEVPNQDPQIVSMRSIIGSRKYQESKCELPMAMGCTISKDVYIADLAKMPHLLVAGATGQGKSVGLNAIITSLIYRKHPAELKFVLVDPKMVEFSLYSALEHHYLAKLPGEEEAIITDTSKVIATLNSLTIEMDDRYSLLKDANVRNIKEYNSKFINRRLNPEKGHKYLPYIVVIVDEFSDLIMTAGKEVETPIARIAQKARAVGIHMIIATQRPATTVITGNIKANFPGRIAFRVTQMVDSRTILDSPGAEQLIGRGDMLFLANGETERVQCAFIDTPEVEAICEHIKNQVGYAHAYSLPEFIPDKDGEVGGSSAIEDRDSLFEEAARFIITGTTASTSSLQRRYSIGYNRAGKIMDQLEAAGIVGPAVGGKPRQVLMDPMSLEIFLNN